MVGAVGMLSASDPILQLMQLLHVSDPLTNDMCVKCVVGTDPYGLANHIS